MEGLKTPLLVGVFEMKKKLHRQMSDKRKSKDLILGTRWEPQRWSLHIRGSRPKKKKVGHKVGQSKFPKNQVSKKKKSAQCWQLKKKSGTNLSAGQIYTICRILQRRGVHESCWPIKNICL